MRADDIETYIAKSTNSIDCKPHYDCFKSFGEGTSYLEDKTRIAEERHSDTYADYREGESCMREICITDDELQKLKFKFNRSLNSCQIKNKRRINTMY